MWLASLFRRIKAAQRPASPNHNGLARRSLLPPGESEPPPWLEDVTIQLEASPSTVELGQSSVVSWSVNLPSGGSALHVRFNGESVGQHGSRSVAPPRTRTFRVVVSGTHLGVFGETSMSVQVAVTYPSRVVIDPSRSEPVQVLLGALMNSTNVEQTIELCDVDLDLTGITAIEVGSNRSLIASPECARGPRRLGPRIFVTDKRGSAPLFVIRGDNVCFSGFRLEGPTSNMAQGDVKEKGILIEPSAAKEPIHCIEISNMEIFHWSGVGVQVVDNVEMAKRGRLFNTNPGAVRIRGNFFHHNRHGAGEGYGVEVAAGAYATIEQNVFDENRHAIAGGSRHRDELDFSGYTARDNLILSGGGKHCVDGARTSAAIVGGIGAIIAGGLGGLFGGGVGAAIGAVIGAGIGGLLGAILGSICWQTHQIDMHGDGNRWYGSHNWQCGTAGETIIIERNTILYTSGLAIKIRGNPADKAVVDGCVFKHKSRGDAIAQNGACGWGDNISNPIDVRPNNQFGVDPLAELGSGDFFGDGQQDQFMATGVTWWAKSPVTLQWRYLNTMSERLPQLLLTKVDNDAVCDVALRMPGPDRGPRMYSKRGTGPWVPVPVVEGSTRIADESRAENGDAPVGLVGPARRVGEYS